MKRPTWFSVGRLIGRVEPVIWLPAEDYNAALSWAAANTEIPMLELIVAPVWVGHLPPVPSGRARKERVDFARVRRSGKLSR